MGCLSLVQWIFPTQGWNPGLPHCRRIPYQLSHKGRPRVGFILQAVESEGGFYRGRSDEIDPLEEYSGKEFKWGKMGAWGMAVWALEAIQAVLRLNLADGDRVCCCHGA